MKKRTRRSISRITPSHRTVVPVPEDVRLKLVLYTRNFSSRYYACTALGIAGASFDNLLSLNGRVSSRLLAKVRAKLGIDEIGETMRKIVERELDAEKYLVGHYAAGDTGVIGWVAGVVIWELNKGGHMVVPLEDIKAIVKKILDARIAK